MTSRAVSFFVRRAIQLRLALLIVLVRVQNRRLQKRLQVQQAKLDRRVFFPQVPAGLRCYVIEAELPRPYLNSPSRWRAVCRLSSWSREEANALARRLLGDCPHRVVPLQPIQTLGGAR